MPCSRMADGTALSCTATYRKRTDQPRSVAGSKNPLPLGMGECQPWFCYRYDLMNTEGPNLTVKRDVPFRQSN